MTTEQLYNIFLKCECVTTDSRNSPPNSMFFALKGQNFNGNLFATKALDAGCKYAVIDEDLPDATGDDRLIKVGDCLKALQNLAAFHRHVLGTKIIGVTGTNGKTTTKELTAAVLSKKFRVLFTQGNLNNNIGVPLTLLRLRPDHEIAIIEMGASHPGDIKELTDIVDPDYGIISNVGKAHIEGFGSFENIVKTKTELYDHLRLKHNSTIFIDHANTNLQQNAWGLEKIEYGCDEGLYVCGKETKENVFLSFCWQKAGSKEVYHAQTNLIGSYNLQNALAAITIGTFFKVDDALINEAIESYKPQNNRSQLLKTDSNTLIIDAYNANPSSMEAAIRNFSDMNVCNKMLILGDMRELGAASATEHQKIVSLIKCKNFKEVILVGQQFENTASGFPCFENVSCLIEALKSDKPQGRTILIKGSNSTKLYTLPDYL